MIRFYTLLTTICMITLLICAHTDKKIDLDHIYVEIHNSTVADSSFMDELLSFISNDSILHKLRESYMPDLDFYPYFSGQNSIDISVRNRIIYEDIEGLKQQQISNSLLSPEISNVIDNDSLIQVVICLSDFICSKFETVYKNKRIFFDSDSISIDGHPIINVTEEKKIIKSNVSDILFGVLYNRCIPLIYYNNKLFIDPDSIQWLIVRE